MLILLDQDNVLADFEAGFRQAYQARYGEAAPIEDRNHLFYIRDRLPEALRPRAVEIYGSPGFFAELPPIAGALDAARQLAAAGHDVRICTAPITNYRHCVGEKIAWVEEHLGFDWTARVMLTKDKTLVRGDILIDDKPEISGSLTPVWQHWLYDAPYNRHINTPRRIRWQDPASWATLLTP